MLARVRSQINVFNLSTYAAGVWNNIAAARCRRPLKRRNAEHTMTMNGIFGDMHDDADDNSTEPHTMDAEDDTGVCVCLFSGESWRVGAWGTRHG